MRKRFVPLLFLALAASRVCHADPPTAATPPTDADRKFAERWLAERLRIPPPCLDFPLAVGGDWQASRIAIPSHPASQ
jgi:hypothetical protein